MRHVYEAIIHNHSDFGSIVFREFYDTDEKAQGALNECLNGHRTSDPEYAHSYEGYVYRHKVR